MTPEDRKKPHSATSEIPIILDRVFQRFRADYFESAMAVQI